MEIRISPKAWLHTRSSKTREWLKRKSGKYVKVDTKSIFGNQYNVDGYRVYDSMIDAIKGDKRKKMKTDAYGRKWEDQYFLSHNVKPKMLPVDTEVKFQGKKVRLYNVNDDYYRLSRRRTLEFIFDKKGKIYIANGIGFRSAKELSKVKVSAKLNNAEMKLLRKAVNKIKSGKN